MEQTIYRTHHCLIWNNDINVNPVIPSPLEYSWFIENNDYIPITSLNPPAPETMRLIKCYCRVSKCEGLKCKCRKENLRCTGLCGCSSEDEDRCLDFSGPSIDPRFTNDDFSDEEM